MRACTKHGGSPSADDRPHSCPCAAFGAVNPPAQSATPLPAPYASWTVDTDTYEFPEGMTWRQRVAAVRKADEPRAAGRGTLTQGDSFQGDSFQGDVGDDGQVVAAGGGQGADVAHGGGTGHDLVDPGHREGGGEAEGEPALRKAQL